MVTLWWCLTYMLITYWWHVHHLLYWCGCKSHDDSLLIRVHFLQWHGLVGFPPRHPYLFIVLHDSFLIMHYWSFYCPLWCPCVLVMSAALLLYCSLEYISQSAGSLLPQTWLLSLYYCTLVEANRPQIPTPLLPARTHSKLFFAKRTCSFEG